MFLTSSTSSSITPRAHGPSVTTCPVPTPASGRPASGQQSCLSRLKTQAVHLEKNN